MSEPFRKGEEPSSAVANATEFTPDQQVFDQFYLREFVGYGCFQDEIWIAHNALYDREVTLHFLPEFLRYNDQAIQELQEEVHRNMLIEHHGVLSTYDFVRSGGLAAIEMESPGSGAKSLARLLETKCLEGALFRQEEILPWIKDSCCRTLSEVYLTYSRVHGDLRAETLFLRADRQLKISNFGTNRLVGSWALLLKESTAANRDAYLASRPPELADIPDMIPNPRLDTFGAGALLYRMLTGEHPKVKEPDEMRAVLERAELEKRLDSYWKEEVLLNLSSDPQNDVLTFSPSALR